MQMIIESIWAWSGRGARRSWQHRKGPQILSVYMSGDDQNMSFNMYILMINYILFKTLYPLGQLKPDSNITNFNFQQIQLKNNLI